MRRRLPLAVTLTASLFFTAAPARAEADARSFLARIDAGGPEAEMLAELLLAYGEGISWANVQMAENGQPRLYCPPANRALTVAQNVNILRRFVERIPEAGSSPAGLVLLFAYKDAFPCPTT